MKTLSKHIEETLNKKSAKEVSKDKTVDEDSVSFMRASPAVGSILTRGTTRDDEKGKD